MKIECEVTKITTIIPLYSTHTVLIIKIEGNRYVDGEFTTRWVQYTQPSWSKDKDCRRT